MTRLKRQSLDICFFGGKGRGKNIVLAYYGFKKWLDGFVIYSNFMLSYPFIYISSLADLEGLNLDKKPALFLFDDAEEWLSSRRSLSTQNLTVSNIIIKLGKRNVYTLWSCKRPKNVEVELRNTSDFFVRVQLMLRDSKKILDVGFDDAVSTIENLCILLTVYDYQEKLYKYQVLNDLDIWVELFDTSEEVKKFTLREKSAPKKILLGGGCNRVNDIS